MIWPNRRQDHTKPNVLPSVLPGWSWQAGYERFPFTDLIISVDSCYLAHKHHFYDTIKIGLVEKWCFQQVRFWKVLDITGLSLYSTSGKSRPLESVKRRCQYRKKFDSFICRLSEEDKNYSSGRQLPHQRKDGRKRKQIRKPKDSHRFTMWRITCG